MSSKQREAWRGNSIKTKKPNQTKEPSLNNYQNDALSDSLNMLERNRDSIKNGAAYDKSPYRSKDRSPLPSN